MSARVYDSDIHADANGALRELAETIAETYAGNWEAMIQWKLHVAHGLQLQPQDVRTILNMTLSDVTQNNWHPEIRQHLVRFTPPPFVEPRPRLRVVRDPEPPKRKWFVRVRARFRADVFRPNHKMGKIHLVDHGRTFVEWNIPHRPFATEDDPKVPKLIVFGWCGKRYDNVLIPDMVTDDSSQVCAGCRRVRDEVGKPPSQTRVCH